MKILLALCISMFATGAFACTDFSGKYINTELEVYTVEQSGCESVTYIEDDGDRKIYIADGEYRLTEDDEDIRIYTATNFIGDNITLDSKIEYKKPFPPEMPEASITRTSKLIYTKDADGNLIENFYIYNSEGVILGSATTTHPKV